MKRTKVIFPKKAIEKQMLDFVIKEQTTRLIAYAEQQMEKIGERIAWNDHGNLLDSLCWAVYYNGNMRRCGYYRKSEAIEDTYLHALSKSIRQPINGHAEAQTFLAQYVPTEQSGWEVIWAVAAPYWGYWEKGFRFKLNPRSEDSGYGFMQFASRLLIIIDVYFNAYEFVVGKCFF